jgi:23S rRNA pseudouridine2605 synthase
MAERLQKYLARSGVASRRHAETLITEGRVTVNNQPATTLGTKVEPNDLVALDGKLVMPPEEVSWYVLYKPEGVVTTLDDPQGRPTVRGLLGSIPTRVFPIGRLDWDAEGALLLTDDGAAAHRLLHPSFQVPRTYLAKVKGNPTDESLARLVAGVRLEDGPARALEVERFQVVERNTWVRVTVGEGRPHLVKRLCAAIGHPVLRLFRPHQAGISVAGMQPGEVRSLRPEELALLTAVAAGQPVPPMTLKLPARRHGRADEEAETEGEAEARPRAPKPPRFGTRAWRNTPHGPGPKRPDSPQRGEAARAGGNPRTARPAASDTGFARSGAPRGFKRAGPREARGRPEAGRASWTPPRERPPATEGERPARRGKDGAAGSRDFRTAGRDGATRGHSSFGRRTPREPTSSPRGGRQGPSFHGKPAEGRGGWKPRAPGGRPGMGGRDARPEERRGAAFKPRAEAGRPRFGGSEGRAGGFAPRGEKGGAGFRGRPAEGGQRWKPRSSETGRGHPEGGGPGPGKRFPPRSGEGFRGRTAEGRSEGSGRPERGFGGARSPRGRAPPRGRPEGGRGERPAGAGRFGGPPSSRGRPGGSSPRPSPGGSRGRPPEGRRGPPRPRGGAPRGPKR